MATKNCNMCPLAAKLQVPGNGNKNPKLIVMGDYPNREDEKSGAPFTGDKESANTIIKRALHSMGYDHRNDAYYAYALRCNPFHGAGKGKVTEGHLKACRQSNLETELAEVDCPLVLALGWEAMQSLLPDNTNPLVKMRGKWHTANIGGKERLVRVTFGLGQVNRMSLWHVQENDKTGKIERVRRWNPIGTCGYFFQEDLKAVVAKLTELGHLPARKE